MSLSHRRLGLRAAAGDDRCVHYRTKVIELGFRIDSRDLRIALARAQTTRHSRYGALTVDEAAALIDGLS